MALIEAEESGFILLEAEIASDFGCYLCSMQELEKSTGLLSSDTRSDESLVNLSSCCSE